MIFYVFVSIKRFFALFVTSGAKFVAERIGAAGVTRLDGVLFVWFLSVSVI